MVHKYLYKVTTMLFDLGNMRKKKNPWKFSTDPLLNFCQYCFLPTNLVLKRKIRHYWCSIHGKETLVAHPDLHPAKEQLWVTIKYKMNIPGWNRKERREKKEGDHSVVTAQKEFSVANPRAKTFLLKPSDGMKINEGPTSMT
jgi:hypothetical protein